MKRNRFTEEQIIAVLREDEAGARTADVARKHGTDEISGDALTQDFNLARDLTLFARVLRRAEGGGRVILIFGRRHWPRQIHAVPRRGGALAVGLRDHPYAAG